MTLPVSNAALLVRTDFADDASWELFCEEIAVPSEEGFTAALSPVSAKSFSGSSWKEIKAAVPTNNHGSRIVCIADTTTLRSADHPVLVVDLMDFRGERLEPFRCIPAELWGVENNLNIANMDWNDFADATDELRVFRGFPPTPPSTQEQLRVHGEYQLRLAAAQAGAAAEAERLRQVRAEEAEKSWWGGQPPSPGLRAAGPSAPSLARRDYEVAEALVRLDEQTQRQVILWAVHMAVDASAERYQTLLAPAVVALERGEPLPAPFDSGETAWPALLGGNQIQVVSTLRSRSGPEPARKPLAAHAAALSAILIARRDQEVGRAVIATVAAAASGSNDLPRFFNRLRAAFDLPR